MRVGNFFDMGTRRQDSAEGQVLRQQPLTRHEITDHIVAGTTVTFSTRSGVPVTMSVADARRQGLVGNGR